MLAFVGCAAHFSGLPSGHTHASPAAADALAGDPILAVQPLLVDGHPQSPRTGGMVSAKPTPARLVAYACEALRSPLAAGPPRDESAAQPWRNGAPARDLEVEGAGPHRVDPRHEHAVEPLPSHLVSRGSRSRFSLARPALFLTRAVTRWCFLATLAARFVAAHRAGAAAALRSPGSGPAREGRLLGLVSCGCPGCLGLHDRDQRPRPARCSCCCQAPPRYCTR